MMNSDISVLRSELAFRIDSHAQVDGDHETSVPGLVLTRRTDQTPCYRATYHPSLTIFAQGKKCIELGGVKYQCDCSSFFLSSIDVPVQSQIVEASPSMPLLMMKLYLDMDSVREILNRENLATPKSNTHEHGLAVGVTTVGLVSACNRLIDLLETPEDIPFLHSLIQREILYRVLRTPQAQGLRAIVTNGELSNRTARVISWLRKNYAQPLHMEELADLARMGVSTLHHEFRALTSMSPLQYQKQIRLQVARERMLMDGVDATNAAHEVGYESVSQFNREYSRNFGMPPMRDVKTFRERREVVTVGR